MHFIDLETISHKTFRLWKESLNREGHQFLKYQQNEQSPLTLTEHKKTTTYDIVNLGPGLIQAQTCGRVKLVNGIRFYFTLILPDLDYIMIGFISIYLCNQCLKPVRCDVHSCRGVP